MQHGDPCGRFCVCEPPDVALSGSSRRPARKTLRLTWCCLDARRVESRPMWGLGPSSIECAVSPSGDATGSWGMGSPGQREQATGPDSGRANRLPSVPRGLDLASQVGARGERVCAPGERGHENLRGPTQYIGRNPLRRNGKPPDRCGALHRVLLSRRSTKAVPFPTRRFGASRNVEAIVRRSRWPDFSRARTEGAF